MGIKVRNNAIIVGRSFEELKPQLKNVVAVAIARGHETIIPNDKDKIKADDIVYFITERSSQIRVLEMCGKEVYDVRNILFLGGSRIAMKTIEKLGTHYNVKVIESNSARCDLVADRFEHVLVINGDGSNLGLLKEEGISRMDAIIATTGSSEVNILTCRLAKTLGVKRTVAEVENFALMPTAEGLDIGSIINKKLITASYIFRFTLNADISNVKCLTSTDAEVFEFIARPNTRIVSKPIGELNLPAEAKIGGIVRDEYGYTARPDMKIEVGDKVVVFALPSGIRKLEKFFK